MSDVKKIFFLGFTHEMQSNKYCTEIYICIIIIYKYYI